MFHRAIPGGKPENLLAAPETGQPLPVAYCFILRANSELTGRTSRPGQASASTGRPPGPKGPSKAAIASRTSPGIGFVSPAA